jgi:hypothetical protein
MAPRINHSEGSVMPRNQTSTAVLLDAPTKFFSDDECIQRLAPLIEHKDNKNFDEIVALIARLAVPITLY